MNDAGRQTLAMIGIALLVVAGILIYIGWTQPRVYEITDVSEISSETAFESSETSRQVITVAPVVSYPLNLNTATYDELITIDGIGDARAVQIIQYREEIGAYTSVEQIKNISGIGDSIYNKISPYLTV